MSYSAEVIHIAKDRLNERRTDALRVAEYKRDQLYATHPRLSEIERELISVGALTAKAAVMGDRAHEELDKLRHRSLSLQEEYRDILDAAGYGADYLEPRYHCAVCSDTGYVEHDNRTVMCDCYRKLLSAVACEQLNAISPLSLSSFEDFDLSLYDDQPEMGKRNPRRRMTAIYDYCVQYADTFSLSSKNLLMTGATGLGKTHLSLAIARRVIERGFSVVYVSSPEILSRLEREHFDYRYEGENKTFASLLACDLLILDDLGTEFQSAFSKAAVYHIFNARILKGSPIIINTNLPLSELETMYSQRFVSRAAGSCDRLDFIGSDIRLKK